MKQEHIDRIKSYYDMAGEFKQNNRYSEEPGTVYTKDGNRYHWLVLEKKEETDWKSGRRTRRAG